MRIPAHALLTAIYFLGISFSEQNLAQDSFFDIVEVDTPTQTETEDKNWTLRGHIQQELKYGLYTPDENFSFARTESGLSQFRTETFLEFAYRFNEDLSAQISAKNEIDWLRWDNLAQEGEQEWRGRIYDTILKDAYIDYTFDNQLWLRAGNQVIAWGESEGMSITDVLSTKDLREPGQAELEDIREAIPALMLSNPLVVGETHASLNIAVTYKAGSDRYAQKQEDFYPLIAFADYPQVQFTAHEPVKDWEAALQYLVHANGGDFGVVVAEVNNNTPEIFNVQLDLQSMQPIEVGFFQRRQLFYGMSANKVVDSFLLRGELGVLKETNAQLNTDAAFSKEKQKRLMFGLEYSGWNDWLLSAEYNFLDREDTRDPFRQDEQSGYVFRGQYTALNEKLVSQLWYIKLAEEGGKISRLNLSYKPIDNWEVSAAWITYENDKPGSTLYAFRNNDTVNLALKYGF